MKVIPFESRMLAMRRLRRGRETLGRETLCSSPGQAVKLTKERLTFLLAEETKQLSNVQNSGWLFYIEDFESPPPAYMGLFHKPI